MGGSYLTYKKLKIIMGKQEVAKVKKGAPGKPGKPRNYELKPGLMRFGRSKMYKKRALHRITALRKAAKLARPEVPVRKTRPVPKLFVEKPIGGDKNGGTRKVRIKKLPRVYDTQVLRKKQYPRKKKTPKITKLRKTITPGTVCILVATPHKGKRVVFLKQMPSGLCLVTGPFWLNHVPLRRVNQNYLMATKTKIDISKVKIPEHVTDEYFKRAKSKPKNKKDDGEIFTSKKKKYQPSIQRKHDTIVVDRQVMKAVNKSGMGKALVQYLCSKFGLQNHQYPHEMKF